MALVEKLRELLKGKKSYVMGALAAVGVLAHHLGWVDDKGLETVLQLAGVGWSVTMAAKVNRALGGGKEESK